MGTETGPVRKRPGLQAFCPPSWETKKLLDWWGKAVFFSLCVAIGLLGIGRVAIPFLGGTFSAWSVSRTTFIFWFLWKLRAWHRYGHEGLEWRQIFSPLPLALFFASVTASLLPYFEHPKDYRYFFFACFHYLMVRDLFREGSRPRVLFCLLGIAPGFLFVRGVLSDFSVLNLSQMVRFGFPLDHPNTAGYVFSMGIPLALAVVLTEKGWFRRLAVFSSVLQCVGLFLSYSRTAWASSLVSLLALVFLERRLRKGLLISGLAVLLVFAISPALRSRFGSLLDLNKDPEDMWRFEVMAHSVFLAQDDPLLGVGYGRHRLRAALKEKYPNFAAQQYVHHSHNVYAELVAGTGFVGLGTFLWLLFSTIRRLLWKARSDQLPGCRSLYLCLLASLVAFMVSGLGDVPFYHHETRIFFFTLLALIYLHLQEESHPLTVQNRPQGPG